MPKASNLRLSDLILQTNAIHRTCRQGTPASDPSPHGHAIDWYTRIQWHPVRLIADQPAFSNKTTPSSSHLYAFEG